VEETDHWHCRLLRPSDKRPRGRRAAEKRDELAPFELSELHPVPASQRCPIAGYRIGKDQSEVSERFCNLSPIGEGSQCRSWVDGVEKGLVIFGEQ
jgi:hypothetical protein